MLLTDFLNNYMNNLNNPFFTHFLSIKEIVFLQNLHDNDVDVLKQIFQSVNQGCKNGGFQLHDIPIILHFISIIVRSHMRKKGERHVIFVAICKFILETLASGLVFTSNTNLEEVKTIMETSMQLLDADPVVKVSLFLAFYKFFTSKKISVVNTTKP